MPYRVRKVHHLRLTDFNTRQVFSKWFIGKFHQNNEFCKKCCGLVNENLPITDVSTDITNLAGNKKINICIELPVFKRDMVLTYDFVFLKIKFFATSFLKYE